MVKSKSSASYLNISCSGETWSEFFRESYAIRPDSATMRIYRPPRDHFFLAVRERQLPPREAPSAGCKTRLHCSINNTHSPNRSQHILFTSSTHFIPRVSSVRARARDPPAERGNRNRVYVKSIWSAEEAVTFCEAEPPLFGGDFRDRSLPDRLRSVTLFLRATSRRELRGQFEFFSSS